MAKKSYVLYKLLSSAGTGYFYVGTKSTKFATRKLSVRKYDPLVNQYVVFNETKLASGRKR